VVVLIVLKRAGKGWKGLERAGKGWKGLERAYARVASAKELPGK